MADRCWGLVRAHAYDTKTRRGMRVTTWGWCAVEYERVPRRDAPSLYVWSKIKNIGKTHVVDGVKLAETDGHSTGLPFVKHARDKAPALSIEDYVTLETLAEWRLGVTLYLRVAMNIEPWINHDLLLRTVLISKRFRSRAPWDKIAELGEWKDPFVVAASLGVMCACTPESLDGALRNVSTLRKRPKRITIKARAGLLNKQSEAGHESTNRINGS